jgi:hypothetical protein
VTTGPEIGRLADLAEIREVLSRYARAFSGRDIDLMDNVFSPDAMIDYSAIGGSRAPWPETKQWLRPMVMDVELFLLYVGDVYPTFAPDRNAAEVETTWHGVFVATADAVPLLIYGSYLDQFVRTAEGWRIADRTDRPAIQLPAPAPST